MQKILGKFYYLGLCYLVWSLTPSRDTVLLHWGSPLHFMPVLRVSMMISHMGPQGYPLLLPHMHFDLNLDADRVQIKPLDWLSIQLRRSSTKLIVESVSHSFDYPVFRVFPDHFPHM